MSAERIPGAMADPGDRGDDADADGAGTDDDSPDIGDGEEFPCPECGDTLPAGARFCPHCATPLDEGGEVVDLSELDGRFGEEDAAELLRVEEGRRRASGRVMVVAGLAVAVPLAPLGLFLVGTVAPLSVWSAALVFLGAWLAPAAYLARARVPAEAFARSLTLVAVGTALIPVGLRIGGSGLASTDLTVPYGTVTAVALVVAGLALVLGRYMHGQANRRISGDARAFEDARPDSEDAEEN